ncbi:MAG: lytic polysaccharide monooxygenase [Actinomycetota bacterium]
MIRCPRTLRAPALTGIVAVIGSTLALLAPAPAADAHGSTQEPASRTYACRFDDPDNPMCAQAWSTNSQALYDWMEVNIGDAAGRHRQLIPDGRLCSAGRAKYAAFDRPGAWPTTALRTDGSGHVVLTYENTAPHATEYYRVYLTRPGFDARTDVLAWDDLELQYDSGPLGLATRHDLRVPLPNRAVPAIVYVVWQRSDSPEAFYACSDVTVDAGDGPAPPTSTTSPVPQTTAPPVTTASTTEPPASTSTPSGPATSIATTSVASTASTSPTAGPPSSASTTAAPPSSGGSSAAGPTSATPVAADQLTPRSTSTSTATSTATSVAAAQTDDEDRASSSNDATIASAAAAGPSTVPPRSTGDVEQRPAPSLVTAAAAPSGDPAPKTPAGAAVDELAQPAGVDLVAPSPSGPWLGRLALAVGLGSVAVVLLRLGIRSAASPRRPFHDLSGRLAGGTRR